MTKIDSLNTPPPIPSRAPKTESPARAAPEQAEATPTSDPNQIRNRISQWFAQAGIRAGYKNLLEDSPSERVARRQAMRQQRQLKNLESIMELALEFSPSQYKEEALDPDWFFSFIQMAEDIYSPAMQELWGKIFAVEVSQPGSFSLRSLNILKQLTQKDAKIFALATSMASRRKGDFSPRIFYGYYQKPSFLSLLSLHRSQQLNLAQYGLAYPDLLSLMDLGLIYSSEIESGEMDTSSRTEWRCGGESIHLAARSKGIILKYYKFTSAGAELCRLVPSKGNSAYLTALRQLLSSVFEVN
ncbi:TIGR03899 family protein [Aliiglaciecola sp. CAU 1673]|uniref:TIGR03899 family protein n=1 Tax=Aliiglaciecola sp. CAU 1673 TaxID=3032595 RepID=UPI0023DBC0A9|nr:TIGR03899 family protein [Aliiglaciecola sp. CAU 1673]MDF2180331.1 TIGR03899 family protein [Aliiglaciecola sp. CAU 1673]